MMKQTMIVLSIGFMASNFAPLKAMATYPIPELSDGQVARIMESIDQSEIEAARIARKNVQDSSIKDFAKTMENEHTLNQTAVNQIAFDDSIGLRDSAMNRDIMNEAMTCKSDLKTTSTMDKTYISQQVSVHQEALDSINNILLPNVKNGDLRAQLEKNRQAVSDHLQRAKELQSQLE